MKLTSIGQKYLVRKLELKSTIKKVIEVKIGFPQKFPDSTDYFCPYQILGLGNENIDYCGGIDEVQAVLLSMERIGEILYASDEYKNGDLHWEGSTEGNLGFPVFDSSRLLSSLKYI